MKLIIMAVIGCQLYHAISSMTIGFLGHLVKGVQGARGPEIAKYTVYVTF